jgi:serine/threonine-protein kinase
MKTRKKYCCYELVERLATGGMGEVWKAKHRMLTRPAAVKFIRPEVVGASSESERDTVFKRFQQEAQTIAMMHSPHTIHLYDFGVSDDGAFYYVMELLDGIDLRDFVNRFGPVPPARTIQLLRQVCDSLAEAHENGLIHRDIKPANVFTCRYGRKVDFIKVLDFGLAKLRPEIAGSDPVVTDQDVIGGTPAFLAPEQVLGDQPVDGRADIYAVGCLGYWLLTGQLLFEAPTAMKVIMDHVQTPAIAPSRRSEFEIPDALDQIILNCLEKNPAGRPQDADSLADRLSAVVTSDAWTSGDARAWWDMHMPQAVAVSSQEE